MKAIPEGAHVMQLERLLSVNCYLVREADGLTLVDTNLPGSAHSILVQAERWGMPIRRIVLTHAHTDHVGSLDALMRELRDVEVIMTARDARLMAGDFSLDATEPQADLKGSFTTVATVPTKTVSDGDTIGSLRVLASPGHTPGHMSLLDLRDNTLLAGDAWQTRGGVAVAGILRPLFPIVAPATWHVPTAFGSALRLRALRPSRLAPGHGPVLDDPLAKMDGALSEAQRRLG